jgi:hypothetical protein
MYIISVCHGEYDDYTDTPVAVVSTQEEAELVAEALEKKESPYFDTIMTPIFPFCRNFYRDFNFGINIQKVPVVSI